MLINFFGILSTTILIGHAAKIKPFKGSDILKQVALIDGHNDLPMKIYHYAQNKIKHFHFDTNLLEDKNWTDPLSDTDIPRLRKGNVGGQFFAAYVDCEESHYKDAVRLTLDQIDVIKRLVNKYPNDLKFVTTAQGIIDAFNEGKIASMIGVEGGHSIDSRSSILRLYHELGVRYLTLTHNCKEPWVDTHIHDNPANDEYGIITEFGLNEIIPEMNRLGMMIDLSHVSKGVMELVLNKTKAPVIFSHSSAYNVTQHTRNVQDDILYALKENQGIIMINFLYLFIASENSATIDDVIKHIVYIKDTIGIDYVGLGSDFDGTLSLNGHKIVEGLEDVSCYPNLFDKLYDNEGFSPEDLQKLASGNLLRVFRAVEEVSADMQSDPNIQVAEEHVPKKDLDRVIDGDIFACRSDKNMLYPPDV